MNGNDDEKLQFKKYCVRLHTCHKKNCKFAHYPAQKKIIHCHNKTECKTENCPYFHFPDYNAWNKKNLKEYLRLMKNFVTYDTDMKEILVEKNTVKNEKEEVSNNEFKIISTTSEKDGRITIVIQSPDSTPKSYISAVIGS